MKKIQNELTPPRQLVPDLSERVDWAIRRAMSANPEGRPSSCREFVEDLIGHSTKRISTAEVAAAVAADLWYLVYKDEDGETHTVKGSTSAIRRSLRDGLMGEANNVRASRTKTGPFEPVRSYPEFRDLVIEPSAVGMPAVAVAPSTPIPEPAGVRPAPPPPRSGVVRGLSDVPTEAYVPADPPPHISLDEFPNNSPQSLEWVKWIFFLVLALSSAAVAFYYLWPGR
jgi:hypothetical protein